MASCSFSLTKNAEENSKGKPFYVQRNAALEQTRRTRMIFKIKLYAIVQLFGDEFKNFYKIKRDLFITVVHESINSASAFVSEFENLFNACGITTCNSVCLAYVLLHTKVSVPKCSRDRNTVCDDREQRRAASEVSWKRVDGFPGVSPWSKTGKIGRLRATTGHRRKKETRDKKWRWRDYLPWRTNEPLIYSIVNIPSAEPRSSLRLDMNQRTILNEAKYVTNSSISSCTQYVQSFQSFAIFSSCSKNVEQLLQSSK